MEREIEIKVLNVDLEAMERRLIEKGASKIGEEEQANGLIDSSSHPIEEKSGYLRIRRSRFSGEEKTVLTFKEKKASDSVRVYDEHTIVIDDAKEMLAILKCMGYDRVEWGHKHRISYRYMGCRLDLDRWKEEDYPDPYMEIEGPNREAIEKVVDALAIGRDALSTKSIAELRNSKNK